MLEISLTNFSLQVFLPIASPHSHSTPLLWQADDVEEAHLTSTVMAEAMNKLGGMENAQHLTARERISLCALSAVLSSPPTDFGSGVDTIPTARQALAIITHLAALRQCGLAQRSFSKREPVESLSSSTQFLTFFFDATSDCLCSLPEILLLDMPWDAFDLFDGRLYLNILGSMGAGSHPWVQKLLPRASEMVKILDALVGGTRRPGVSDILSQAEELASLNPSEPPLCLQSRQPEPAPSLLPFSHPIIDPYLTAVRLSAGVMSESSVSQSIFKELAHWHNSRVPLDPKHVAKPRGFWAQKRHQKLMSDTMAYSASLTGASGKIIEPEVVVTVAEVAAKKNIPIKTPHTVAKKPEGRDARTSSTGNKSNKQKALEQADARRQEKLTVVLRSVAAAWRARCVEFEREPSLIRRFNRAEKYLVSLSSGHEQVVGSEALLYLGHVLLQLRRSSNTPENLGG